MHQPTESLSLFTSPTTPSLANVDDQDVILSQQLDKQLPSASFSPPSSSSSSSSNFIKIDLYLQH
eukprot:scaffold8993_cov207-Skeletonema_marinoi.AAC.42